MQTDGQRALLQILTPIGTASRRALAREIGVSHTVFVRWESGATRPEPHFRLALQRIHKIPAEAWLTPTEKAIAFGTPVARPQTVVRDEDVPEYDPAVDEPSPEEVAS